MEELIYTFKFGIQGRTVAEDHITIRKVPFSKLLDSFDAALDWVLTNPEKRYAELFGPGMKTRTITPSMREYILKNLPDNMPEHRAYIGLAWMVLDDRALIVPDFRLYKLWKAEVPLPDLPERPETHYGLMEVDPEDWSKAFEWAQANRWQDFGIWFRNRPGLVFCPDFEAVAEAFKHIIGVGVYLETGKLERAPVRYGWAAYEDAYPRMKPTRSTPEIQRLRAQYPTAGEDLKVCPLEILIQKYGYSEARV